MIRQHISSALLCLVFVGFVAAEEFPARITKVGEGKITFVRATKGEKTDFKSAPTETLLTSDYVKVFWAKTNPETKKIEAGEPVPGGLKNEQVLNATGTELGLSWIITDDKDKTIKELRVPRLVIKPSKDKDK